MDACNENSGRIETAGAAIDEISAAGRFFYDDEKLTERCVPK